MFCSGPTQSIKKISWYAPNTAAASFLSSLAPKSLSWIVQLSGQDNPARAQPGDGTAQKIGRDGRQRGRIAEYCETDVVNTYRVWLRYELFRGRLTEAEYQTSEACLGDLLKARGNTKPHLAAPAEPTSP